MSQPLQNYLDGSITRETIRYGGIGLCGLIESLYPKYKDSINKLQVYLGGRNDKNGELID